MKFFESGRTRKLLTRANVNIDFQIDAAHILRKRYRYSCVQTVTLSSKFQIVIPQALRETLKLRPGEKFQVVSYDDRIELIPVRAMKQTRGFLKGMNPKMDRVGKPRAL